jgi:hypothetical protein
MPNRNLNLPFGVTEKDWDQLRSSYLDMRSEIRQLKQKLEATERVNMELQNSVVLPGEGKMQIVHVARDREMAKMAIQKALKIAKMDLREAMKDHTRWFDIVTDMRTAIINALEGRYHEHARDLHRLFSAIKGVTTQAALFGDLEDPEWLPIPYPCVMILKEALDAHEQIYGNTHSQGGG